MPRLNFETTRLEQSIRDLTISRPDPLTSESIVNNAKITFNDTIIDTGNVIRGTWASSIINELSPDISPVKDLLWDIKQTAPFWNEISLKPRTGSVKRNLPEHETIAEHTAMSVILSYAIGKELGLDSKLCMDMALVHDMPESIIHDYTPEQLIGRDFKGIARPNDILFKRDSVLDYKVPENIKNLIIYNDLSLRTDWLKTLLDNYNHGRDTNKYEQELVVMENIANYAKNRELLNLFVAFEEQQTYEARIVKWSDALCTVTRAVIDSAKFPYIGHGTFDGYWVYTALRIDNAPTEIKSLYTSLLNQRNNLIILQNGHR